jgi:hypothetical protein
MIHSASDASLNPRLHDPYVPSQFALDVVLSDGSPEVKVSADHFALASEWEASSVEVRIRAQS